jgi:hypothetical protein
MDVLSPYGFSFKKGIVNKATDDQLSKLGRGWVWVEDGSPEHLLNCLTDKGWAVTPGRWQNGWKHSKNSVFWGATYMFLDFDGEVPMQSIIDSPFVKSTALFLYTTASHGIKKGDRFRVVFKLDNPCVCLSQYDKILKGLKHILPGSDPAINAASLLYGCNHAQVRIFDMENTLDSDFCLEIYEMNRPVVVRNFTTSNRHFDGNTERNVRTWLMNVPADGYNKWIKIAAWIKSIANSGELTEEQALNIFIDWSISNYVGENNKRNDEDYIVSCWDRLSGGGYGLVKLKQLAEYTARFDHKAIEEMFN